MIKKLTLILLCSPGLLAMQDNDLAPLRLELKDGFVEVSRHVVELSKTIEGALELIDDDQPISLPQVTQRDWHLIHTFITLAASFTREKTEGFHQALLTSSLKNLSADELLSCLRTADFLAVQEVFDACLELAYAGHLNSLSYEQLSKVPASYVDEIIVRRARAACGPYEATQIARYNNTFVISAMCITHDGNIVLGSANGKITILDKEGNQLINLTGHKNWVYTVCITKNGKIISGSADRTVRVWDMKGNQLAVCEDHEDAVNAVCVSTNGKIISGSDDRTVRVWDMKGNQLAVCEGHEDVINAVCVTTNGKIISGSDDRTVRVWDMEGNQLAVCEGHQDSVWDVCITPDGKIVSGGYDEIVRVWDVEGNQLAVCEGHRAAIYALCITHNGGKVLSGGGYDETVRAWDIEGNQLAVCKGHDGWVKALCVTLDGKIVSGGQDCTIRVWDIEGNQLAVCKGHKDYIKLVCLMSDGKIISGSADGTVRIWDATLSLTDVQAETLWVNLQKNSKIEETKLNDWKQIKQLLQEKEEHQFDERN